MQKFLQLGGIPLVPFESMHTGTRAVFAKAAQTVATQFYNHPTEENLLRLVAMPKLVIGTSIRETRELVRDYNSNATMDHHLQKRITSWTNQRVTAHAPPPAPVDDDDDATDLPPPVTAREKRLVERLIQAGQVGKAAKVVTGRTGVAPATPEVIAQLEAKHPPGVPNPFGDAPGNPPPRLSDDNIGILDQLVSRLNIEASPGISGWSPQLVKLCYGLPEKASPLRKCLFRLAQLMLAGQAPCPEILTTSRLTPLQQSPTKIRPVACGELFYRLLTRLLIRVLGTRDMLLQNQLGVGNPGGVEPIVHLVQQEMDRLDMEDEAPERYAYSLDLTNAFNTTARPTIAQAVRDHAPAYLRLAKWAYNKPAPLVVRTHEGVQVLWSREGVRQGCPLGPLLFSLALRDKLVRLMGTVAVAPTDITTGYLDDMHVVSSQGNLKDAMVAFFEEDNPHDGLRLNAAKTTVHPLHTLREDPDGMPILGSLIGNVAARRRFLLDKVDALRPSLQRLRQLPRQQGLMLLRQCYAPQLRHLLRSMDLSDLQPELRMVDELLFGTMDYLRGAYVDVPRNERVERIYSLPLSMGGCGLFSYEEIRPAAREASQKQAKKVLRAIVPGQAAALPTVEAEEEAEDPVPTQKALCQDLHHRGLRILLESLTAEEQVAFLDNASKGGTAWMHALPCPTGYRKLTDHQVAGALNIRTLQPDLRRRAFCERCGQPNTILHFEVCGGVQLPGQYRHDYVRDAMAKALRHGQRHVEVEPPLNNNNLQRADIRVGSAEGVPAMDATYGLLDIKIKAPLALDTSNARTAARAAAEPPAPDNEPTNCRPLLKSGWGQIAAALEVAAQATRNHYAPLDAPQPVVPIVISSGGTLHREAYQCLRDLLPGSEERRRLIVDISIALVRARANVYCLA